MSLRTPPSWLQNGSHPAENDRLTTQAIWKTTGIINATDLAVTQNATPGMTVFIAAGWAAILGTFQANMGVYMIYNDAQVIATITTANPSNPRIDLVVATVSDAFYSGSLNQVTLSVIAGTPAVLPVAPAVPVNSISLASIAVGAGVTSILNANITSLRVLATTPFAGYSAPTLGSTVINSGATVSTVSGLTLAGDIFAYPIESWYINATAFAGYTAYLQTNNAVHYLTTASTANGTLNISYSAGTTLNTALATGQSITFALLVTNTGTAYYPTAFQIDGSAVTPKWSGGTAPTAGNASAIDIYQFTILKTGAATFTVLAAGANKYA